jgi:hypothetical protein
MELTQEHFDEIIKGLATKKDLEGLATKEDLKQLVTREYLDQRLLEVPTRQDFNALKTDVAEIKEAVRRIDRRTDKDTRAALKDIGNLQKRVTALEQRLKLQAH